MRHSWGTPGRRRGPGVLMVVASVLGAVALSAGATPGAHQGAQPAVRPPKAPTAVSTTPASVSTPTGSWIGAFNQVTPVAMNATVSSSVSPGSPVCGVFTMTDTTTGTQIVQNVAACTTGSGLVSVGTPSGSVVDGHRYTWTVFAREGALDSRIVSRSFREDAMPPTVVSVTSTDYPSSTSGIPSHLHAGQPGQFTVTTSDQAPTRGRASGILRFEWQLDQAFGVGSGPPPETTTSGSRPGPTATFSVTPQQWGSAILYVRAVDVAGNVSQSAQYSFYVPS